MVFSVPLPVFADDTQTPSTVAPVPTQLQAVDTTTTTAQSGTATVNENTLAANAQTGDATASATVVSAVNSSTSLGNPSTQGSFTKDINGTTTGDVMLDPLVYIVPQNTPIPPYNTIPANSLVSSSQAITAVATSGDAIVSNNTTAGSALSGNAIAHVNSVTVANSVLTSNGSFIGTINIYGDLNGDILLGKDFIPKLITATTALAGASSDSSAASSQSISVANTVALTATSGDAAVSQNTTAGDAISGNAATNLSVYTVVGQDITARNTLLVLINVLGKWVGTIVASPNGATTALLATDILQQSAQPSMVAATSTTNITNIINVSAQSGNALVTKNGTAGDATSGKAFASANIVTIANDRMKLSGWLGILFINVYGNWTGSFGIDTASGNPPQPTQPSAIIINAAPIQTVHPTAGLVTRLIPAVIASTSPSDPPVLQAVAVTQPSGSVLSATTISNRNFDFLIPLLLLGILILTAMLLYKIYKYIQIRRLI